MQLDQLPRRASARIESIDWSALSEGEGRRLRALGLVEGVTVEALHRGIFFWRDPIAVKVGRMTVALRRRHAAAIRLAEEPA